MKTAIMVKESLDEHLSPIISSVFDSVQVIHRDEDFLSLISMDPPDIILVDRTCLKEEKSRIVEEFRNSTLYGHLPIVALYSEKDIEDPAALEIPLDDFIVLGSSELQIRRRIEFIARRSVREKDINPLTRLPGNESIVRCVQRMFDENSEIAIAWVDLDDFGPYNERYGFSSGDEVLLAAARIITSVLRESGRENIFVGHAGGDDFLFICPIAEIKTICEEILSRFDVVIRDFYNEEDLDQGGIVSKARRGEIRKFPVITVSIAVVLNEKKRYRHYGQASQDAKEIMGYVKGLKGSTYMIDRRGGYR
ncbi:MAG: diguanylate cyclase [Desulfomonilia bacterium]|nr:diguanylate cyclase [Deltaproteobacteria bacterium]HPW68135.1 diguanylate cyclase [Deltaproteobacteria bacterium]